MVQPKMVQTSYFTWLACTIVVSRATIVMSCDCYRDVTCLLLSCHVPTIAMSRAYYRDFRSAHDHHDQYDMITVL